MFRHIVANQDKYPLDGVVHWKLEIDYPWVEDVMKEVKNYCNVTGIPYYEISPSVSWYELVEKWGIPTRTCRWCNSKYKLDCMRQFKHLLKEKGFKPIFYIGFCADEVKRFKNDIYPLRDMGVYEATILEWAKGQKVFNDYYKYNKRQGCMYCPMSSQDNLCYLKHFYPSEYEYFMNKCIETEQKYNTTIFQGNPKYDTRYIMKRVEEKEEIIYG